ncbi:hypothetical protein [Aquimarina sediminis]|uniref:hypothetical protein n=1 Tax=Aquimarina sediminis TaxID=2070536 RepID=UPI000FFF218A|nr:hypothetical protein [Aquimarina sediminis]
MVFHHLDRLGNINFGFTGQLTGYSKTSLTNATPAAYHNDHLHSGGAPKNSRNRIALQFKEKGLYTATVPR